MQGESKADNRDLNMLAVSTGDKHGPIWIGALHLETGDSFRFTIISNISKQMSIQGWHIGLISRCLC